MVLTRLLYMLPGHRNLVLPQFDQGQIQLYIQKPVSYIHVYYRISSDSSFVSLFQMGSPAKTTDTIGKKILTYFNNISSNFLL